VREMSENLARSEARRRPQKSGRTDLYQGKRAHRGVTASTAVTARTAWIYGAEMQKDPSQQFRLGSFSSLGPGDITAVGQRPLRGSDNQHTMRQHNRVYGQVFTCIHATYRGMNVYGRVPRVTCQT